MQAPWPAADTVKTPLAAARLAAAAVAAAGRGQLREESAAAAHNIHGPSSSSTPSRTAVVKPEAAAAEAEVTAVVTVVVPVGKAAAATTAVSIPACSGAVIAIPQNTIPCLIPSRLYVPLAKASQPAPAHKDGPSTIAQKKCAQPASDSPAPPPHLIAAPTAEVQKAAAAVNAAGVSAGAYPHDDTDSDFDTGDDSPLLSKLFRIAPAVRVGGVPVLGSSAPLSEPQKIDKASSELSLSTEAVLGRPCHSVPAITDTAVAAALCYVAPSLTETALLEAPSATLPISINSMGTQPGHVPPIADVRGFALRAASNATTRVDAIATGAAAAAAAAAAQLRVIRQQLPSSACKAPHAAVAAPAAGAIDCLHHSVYAETADCTHPSAPLQAQGTLSASPDKTAAAATTASEAVAGCIPKGSFNMAVASNPDSEATATAASVAASSEAVAAASSPPATGPEPGSPGSQADQPVATACVNEVLDDLLLKLETTSDDASRQAGIIGNERSESIPQPANRAGRAFPCGAKPASPHFMKPLVSGSSTIFNGVRPAAVPSVSGSPGSPSCSGEGPMSQGSKMVRSAGASGGLSWLKPPPSFRIYGGKNQAYHVLLMKHRLRFSDVDPLALDVAHKPCRTESLRL